MEKKWILAMAGKDIATFSGLLNSFSINLTLENATKSDMRVFGIIAAGPRSFQGLGQL